MFSAVAGIIANVVEGVASNAITNKMEKGNETGMENDEVWELENGKITAIVRGGVRYVREKTCTLKHTKSGDDYYVFQCSNCGNEVGLHDIRPAKCCYFFCKNCGAKVVQGE